MDIYCPRCTEPWDNDELHEAAHEHDSTYPIIADAFRHIGCAAITDGPDATPTCAEADSEATEMIAVAMSLSPHPDDWATDLDGVL